MTAAVAVTLGALAGWLWAAPPVAARRLHGVGAQSRPGRGRRTHLVEHAVTRTAVCVTGCAVVAWVVGGLMLAAPGAVAGIIVARWIGRLEPPALAAAREQIRRDLPLATDLLAACVAVGRPPARALPAVSRAVGGPLADRLDEVTARLLLGADAATEWARVADDPALRPLGLALARSADSGAPLADALCRLADDQRRERRTASQLRARRVGVRAAGPLAVCFLPSFMAVGVVPTVAGSFQHLFG